MTAEVPPGGSARLKRLARRFAESGYRAFPVGFSEAGTKKPLVRGYFGDEPYSKREWSGQPWSSANHIGLAQRSGTLALDVDVKNGKRGHEHLAALEEALGTLPMTLHQRTPSDGWHLAFACSGYPEEYQFGGRVISPEGARLDIDIIHSRLRYLTVYDVDLWLDDPCPWPELPDTYYPAITRQTRHWDDVPRMTDGFQPPDRELATLVEAVRRGQEGERNNLLFMCGAIAYTRGYTTDAEIMLIAEAALESGLPEDEIEGTLYSAHRIARAREAGVREWETTALRDPHLVGTRSFQAYSKVVAAIADVARICPSAPVIGLPQRNLAIRAGVTKNTVNKYLPYLRDIGLLKMPNYTPSLQGARYSLRIPKEAKEWVAPDWDSPTCTGQLTTKTDGLSHLAANPFEELRATHRRRQARLQGDSAFLRSPRGLTLPPSVAAILIALEMGIATVQEISDITSYSRRTVRDGLRMLLREALITFDEEPGNYSLPHMSAREAVEQWKRRHAIPNRSKRRREQYEQESLAYAAELARRRDSTGDTAR